MSVRSDYLNIVDYFLKSLIDHSEITTFDKRVSTICMIHYLVRYPNLTPHLVLMLFLISSIVRLVLDFAAFAFFSPSNPRKYCSMKGRSFLEMGNRT